MSTTEPRPASDVDAPEGRQVEAWKMGGGNRLHLVRGVRHGVTYTRCGKWVDGNGGDERTGVQPTDSRICKVCHRAAVRAARQDRRGDE